MLQTRTERMALEGGARRLTGRGNGGGVETGEETKMEMSDLAVRSLGRKTTIDRGNQPA